MMRRLVWDPYGPPFSVDHEIMILPIDIFFFEVGQFIDFQTRMKKCPDDELLFMGLARIGQTVCFVLCKRFAFVLVRHWLRKFTGYFLWRLLELLYKPPV
nr:hypothetical protein [Candidatus Manganitrophus noduliformans]